MLEEEKIVHKKQALENERIKYDKRNAKANEAADDIKIKPTETRTFADNSEIQPVEEASDGLNYYTRSIRKNQHTSCRDPNI